MFENGCLTVADHGTLEVAGDCTISLGHSQRPDISLECNRSPGIYFLCFYAPTSYHVARIILMLYVHRCSSRFSQDRNAVNRRYLDLVMCNRSRSSFYVRLSLLKMGEKTTLRIPDRISWRENTGTSLKPRVTIID